MEKKKINTVAIHPDLIEYAVSRAYQVPFENLFFKKSNRKYTDPRKTAYLLLYELSGLKFTEIQKRYHMKAHSSVIELTQTARDLLANNRMFRNKYNLALDIINKELSRKSIDKKKRKKLYNLHYRLREKGVKLSCYKKCVFVPYGNRQQIISEHKKQMEFLINQGYSLQLVIQ